MGKIQGQKQYLESEERSLEHEHGYTGEYDEKDKIFEPENAIRFQQMLALLS